MFSLLLAGIILEITKSLHCLRQSLHCSRLGIALGLDTFITT